MMREETEAATYECKTCNQRFFTYDEVVNHKGMTGHGDYETRQRA